MKFNPPVVLPNALVRVPKAEQGARFHDERGYWEAHEQHVEAAHALSVAGHHQQAHRMLAFAVECYLKEVFCAMRHIRIGLVDKDRQQLTTWDSLPATVHSQFMQALGAKALKHDFKIIGRALLDLCPDLKGDRYFPGLLESLPKGNWIEDRYDDPADHGKKHYDGEYAKIHSAFLNVKAHTFLRFL
jgi:hypothetical protein